MFPAIRSDVESRFGVVERFFKSTEKFKGDLAAAAKGIAFVQVYAIHEFTVKGVVQTAIDSINAHKTKMKNISPALLALYLDPELNAFKDCGKKKLWTSRLKIFERANSNDVVSLSNNTDPPSDGSHYRHTHLVTIFTVFGLKGRPARQERHLLRIDEVVDNRNKIAHGTETAEEVGRRYTRLEIHHAIQQMKSVSLFLIATFERYCATPARHRRR